jgi:hypothetical protein
MLSCLLLTSICTQISDLGASRNPLMFPGENSQWTCSAVTPPTEITHPGLTLHTRPKPSLKLGVSAHCITHPVHSRILWPFIKESGIKTCMMLKECNTDMTSKVRKFPVPDSHVWTHVWMAEAFSHWELMHWDTEHANSNWFSTTVKYLDLR